MTKPGKDVAVVEAAEPASAVGRPPSPTLPGESKPPAPAELTVDELVGQVQLIQDAMKRVMKRGEHYGVIPGTGSKPTLLKPGAEKLTQLFRLAPHYEEAGSVHRAEFIAYRIRCILHHIPTGNVVGEGMGSCNSREKKYRNATPWDIDNTLLKMACKRALIAAVLVATAASDIFTQDVEDDASSSGPAGGKATKGQHSKLNALCAQFDKDETLVAPTIDGKPAATWADYSKHYAKTEFGKDSRADLTAGEMDMLIEHVRDMAVPF